ncbi:torsin-1A-interacting protein 2-like isoform X2 [Hippocampus zosterae]|uniref:torsin-1A-interacting protein 2-like isoform X2 n=1 Tax=Hippocampus zosterae TaxID=109293 RepID=UPI00223DE8D1|nr:torsin-1A-interacting protein 2-like isoform X2 [Hippocampus zosterae]
MELVMEDPPNRDFHLQQEEEEAGAAEATDERITRQQYCSEGDQPEENSVILTDGWSRGELDKPNVENGAAPALDPDGYIDESDHGSAGSQSNEDPTRKEDYSAGEHQPGGEEALEDTAPATEGDAIPDHVDGPKGSLQEDLLVLNDTNRNDLEESRIWDPEGKETAQIPRKVSTEKPRHELRTKVETIGPATQETPVLGVTGIPGVRRYLIGVGIVLALVAILVQRVLRPEPPPPSNTPPIDIFLRQLEKVETRFPHQRPELWLRSRIHLKRHLLTQRPSEPVSLILTAGVAGRRTLRCLARDLASAFSSALNASVLHIDGASKVGQDSDQVKLDIDGQLQVAFEEDKPVAVIHRFEQLPPGSTLIFYRYCDHENAAYKKTFLIFTVLLEGEEEIPAGTSLSAVEEMVDDHLQRKFLSHGRPLAFDRMDLDKYSGLWSRISHLILPVATEAWTEHESCS